MGGISEPDNKWARFRKWWWKDKLLKVILTLYRLLLPKVVA
jgi:hypothetical protein